VLIDWLWWGENNISKPQPSLAYCSSPGWMWVGELWWWWCQLGITPGLPTRAHWQSYQQRHLKRVGGMAERMRILCIRYHLYVNSSFTCHKILWHGTSGFTFHPKEGVLWIFITLKNPSLQPGLNLRPLCAVASTLTTTPLRWQSCVTSNYICGGQSGTGAGFLWPLQFKLKHNILIHSFFLQKSLCVFLSLFLQNKYNLRG
jgi:hypothetical protein